MKNEVSKPDYAMRFVPDFRFRDDKFIDIPLNNFKSITPSVTDKESYRITLSSLRGQLAQGSGKIDVGSYSLKAGEEYNPNIDFSFLNRPDLTIVELDEYIHSMESVLKENDSRLSENIKAELAKAQQRKNELTKQENTADKGEKKE